MIWLLWLIIDMAPLKALLGMGHQSQSFTQALPGLHRREARFGRNKPFQLHLPWDAAEMEGSSTETSMSSLSCPNQRIPGPVFSPLDSSAELPHGVVLGEVFHCQPDAQHSVATCGHVDRADSQCSKGTRRWSRSLPSRAHQPCTTMR